ncbi:MAG: hypothetical protein ACYTGQ_15245, partial [Planctomycetota bacterium]
MNHRVLSLVFLWAIVAPQSPAADRDDMTALDPPLKVSAYLTDGSPIAGRMTAYGPLSFSLLGSTGQTRSVFWQDLEPRHIYLIHSRAFGKNPTARQWFDLGKLLHRRAPKDPLARRAFTNARRLDPELQEQIRVLLSQPATPAAPATPTPESPDPLSAITLPFTPGVSARSDPWPVLTPDQQAEAVEQMKEFAAESL